MTSLNLTPTEIQAQKINAQLDQIHRELLSAAVRDDTGLHWPVPYYENPDEFSFKTTIDLFNGSAGIAIYFIARFEFYGRDEDLKTAEEIMDKALTAEEVLQPTSFGFYTGLTGLVYTCIRLYELNQQKKYLDTAARLIIRNQENMVKNTAKADFLSGYSGSLFVITLLYHHLKTAALLAIIQQLADRLVREARISETGLKWDYNRSKSAFDSLAGFSHGASGIAYSLMQVGQYFQNEALLYLAEQALQYEMQYFHPESENWLDLRLGSYRLSLPDAHKWDLNLFLPEMKEVNSWAHGAAGIGLSRLYAWQITGNQDYWDQCKIILNRCATDLKASKRTDFTLCSGYSGMVPFLLKFQELSGENHQDLWWSMAEAAGQQYEREGSYNTYISAGPSDFGLLSGKTGVAYMLLQLLNPKMANVAYPILPPAPDGTKALLNLYKPVVQQGIFSTYYPKTIQLLNHHEPDFIAGIQVEDIQEFEKELHRKINLLPAVKGWEIMEVFNFESKMTNCWKTHKGHLCYARKNEFIRNRNQQLSLLTEEDFLNLYLELSDHVRFYPLNSGLRNIMGLKQSDQAALFIQEESGLSTFFIGRLPGLIINQLCKEAIKGTALIDALLNAFPEQEQGAPEHRVLKERIILQIKALVRSGIIGPANSSF